MYDLINLDDLRQVGTKQGVSAAVYILTFGCLFTAAVFFFGAIGGFNPVWIAAFVFGACGLAAFAVGLAFILLNAGQIRGIVTRAMTMLDRETEHRFPTPTLPADSTPTPALPEGNANGKTEMQELSRGGERDRLIQGFAPATIMWMCDYLANGNRWSEAALEKMPVPHQQPPARFGKAEGDTIYQRMFHPDTGVFCRAGIIVERGGASNAMGKLAVRSPLEMLRLLKELPDSEIVMQ